MGARGLISVEEKWNAVINCSKEYDGIFYYAVKTTGIFCRPSCKAKAPLKENTLFFQSSYEAMEAGFRPCKICRPDIVEEPYNPNMELIEKVKKFLVKNYNKDSDIKKISQMVGISDSQLIRIFKQQIGITPKEYITELRIKRSKEILKSKDADILEAAQEVGYRSLSAFYKAFKEKTGCTPRNYRERNFINKGE